MHYNADNSYLFVNGNEIFKFKADNKNVNFPAQFCLGSISNGISATESREISLKGNVYDFPVDYSSIDKCGILNTPKYLMTKNNIKLCSAILNKCLLYYWVLAKFLATKCLSLNNELCMIRPFSVDLNRVQLKFYPFMISLD